MCRGALRERDSLFGGAGLQGLGRRLYQGGHAAALPLRPLRGEPVLELGGSRDGESFHERSADEGSCGGPVGGRLARGECVDIEGDRARIQPDRRGIRRDPPLPKRTAQDAQRLIQRVPRCGFLLVSPQQTGEVLAGADMPRGERQVHEQRKVLLPEQFGWRRLTVH